MSRISGPARGEILSKREILVLAKLASGENTKTIAEGWGVTQSTVASHTQSIRRKLGVTNMVHAMAIALATGLLSSSIVEAGDTPLDKIQGDGSRPVAVALYRVTLDSSVSFFLAEAQLITLRPKTSNRAWLQLSGWLTQECAELRALRRAVLSEVVFPSRSCPVGQSVLVRTTRHANEYTLGVYVELRWPKYGVL